MPQHSHILQPPVLQKLPHIRCHVQVPHLRDMRGLALVPEVEGVHRPVEVPRKHLCQGGPVALRAAMCGGGESDISAVVFFLCFSIVGHVGNVQESMKYDKRAALGVSVGWDVRGVGELYRRALFTMWVG